MRRQPRKSGHKSNVLMHSCHNFHHQKRANTLCEKLAQRRALTAKGKLENGSSVCGKIYRGCVSTPVICFFIYTLSLVVILLRERICKKDCVKNCLQGVAQPEKRLVSVRAARRGAISERESEGEYRFA